MAKQSDDFIRYKQSLLDEDQEKLFLTFNKRGNYPWVIMKQNLYPYFNKTKYRETITLVKWVVTSGHDLSEVPGLTAESDWKEVIPKFLGVPYTAINPYSVNDIVMPEFNLKVV